MNLQLEVSDEYELSLLRRYVTEDRQVKMDILLHCLPQKSELDYALAHLLIVMDLRASEIPQKSKQTRPGPSLATAKQVHSSQS